MKAHNKLRRKARRERERAQVVEEKQEEFVDNFSTFYAHQTRHLRSSKGMVQGFYQYVGKVKEETT